MQQHPPESIGHSGKASSPGRWAYFYWQKGHDRAYPPQVPSKKQCVMIWLLLILRVDSSILGEMYS